MFITFYFQPALLLLALSCPVWQVSQSLPVMGKQPATDSCVLYARLLLDNITEVLAQNSLFSGIDCATKSIELNKNTDTPSACAVKGSSCNGKTVSHFDQESCVSNIGKDLKHYYELLTDKSDCQGLLKPTLHSLKQFANKCFMEFLPETSSSKKTADDHASAYNDRLDLCKVLRGFRVRTITINRVISYMNFNEQ